MVCFDPGGVAQNSRIFAGVPSCRSVPDALPSTPPPAESWPLVYSLQPNRKSSCSATSLPLNFPSARPSIIALKRYLPTRLPALSSVLKCPAVSWPLSLEPRKEYRGHAARG